MRVMITGAAGMLGGYLSACFEQHGDIFPVDRNPVSHKNACAIDLADTDEIKRIVQSIKPTHVINSAALTNVDACDQMPQDAQNINADMPAALAKCTADVGAQLIHISTDAVFDGTRNQPYAEEDSTQPVNHYGATKLAGEKAVLKYSRNLVLRTNIFGWNLIRDKQNFGVWLYDALHNKKPVTLFSDIWSSPIYAGYFSAILRQAVGKELQGLYHLAGSTPCSKEQFGRAMAQSIGIDKPDIRVSSFKAHNFIAKRSGYMVLCVWRIEKALGVAMPSMEESITRFLDDKSLRKQWLNLP